MNTATFNFYQHIVLISVRYILSLSLIANHHKLLLAESPFTISGTVKDVTKSDDELELNFLFAFDEIEPYAAYFEMFYKTEIKFVFFRDKKQSFVLTGRCLEEIPIVQIKKIRLDSALPRGLNNRARNDELNFGYSFGCSTAIFLRYNHLVNLSYQQSQALCHEAIRSGIAKFSDDMSAMTYIGTPLGLTKIEMKAKEYSVICNYIQPYSFKNGKYTCDVVEIEKGQEKKYRVTFQHEESNKARIDSLRNKLLKFIPLHHELLRHDDDPIAKRWNGTDFVPYVNETVKSRRVSRLWRLRPSKNLFHCCG